MFCLYEIDSHLFWHGLEAGVPLDELGVVLDRNDEFQALLLFELLVCQRRDDRWPVLGHRRRRTTIFHGPLGLEHMLIKQLSVGLVTKDLLLLRDGVQKLHQEIRRLILHPSQVDNEALRAIVDPVGAQLLCRILEHGDRQLGDRELVDICDDKPLLNLPGQQHIPPNVTCIEVMKRTERGWTYVSCFQHLQEVLEVKVQDGLAILCPPVDEEYAIVQNVEGAICKYGHWEESLPPFQMIEQVLDHFLEIKLSRDK